MTREKPPMAAPSGKSGFFDGLAGRIEGIVRGPQAPQEKLLAVCKVLRDGVSHYDWVGFYLRDPGGKEGLVLGPYVGEPTEHTRISFGRGICGQAAARGETFVVQDVSKAPDYLACSVNVKAEVVAPIFKDGELVGELDVDSHARSPFTDEDIAFLEKVCERVSELF